MPPLKNGKLKPMRFFIFFSVLNILGLVTSVYGTCLPLAEIRSTYFNGEVSSQKTVELLECRRATHPNDVESLRFYSDLLWWEGQGNDSRDVAKEAIEKLKNKEVTGLYLALMRRASRVEIDFNYQDVFGSNRTSYELQAAGSVYYWNNNKFYFRFLRDSRFFNQAAGVSDLVYAFGHIMPLSKHFYFEAEGQFSNSPTFLPEWTASLTPHYIWKNFDFSVLAKFRRYESDDVYSLRPASFISFGEMLRVRLFLDWTLKPDQTVAFGLSPRIAWTPRIDSQITLSGGKVSEGNGLIDNYFSATLGLSYWLTSSLKLNLLGALHRGDLRDENRVGGGAQFRF